MNEKKSLTKRELAAELSGRSGTPVQGVIDMLDALADIACREAVNGFIIPGICKLTVTRRKARRFRHPGTGQLFHIGERDAVTAVILKKCKTGAVSVPDDLISPVDEPDAQSALPPPAPPAPTSSPDPELEAHDTGIVFACDQCGNTLSAPLDQANADAICPFCEAEIRIPPTGQLPDPAPSENERPACKAAELTGFVTFVCETCEQEIEAPYSMIGVEAACPSCGSTFEVPSADATQPETAATDGDGDNAMNRPDMRAMTIRIDLSDVT